MQQAFETIFFDPEENFCHHTEEDAWCMVDTGNMDARTEGMSYGMMMCVQMDRKDIFDRLWTFADRYMRMREGPNEGISPGRCSWTGNTTRKVPRRTVRNISPWRCSWRLPGGATGKESSIIRNRRGKSSATRCTSMNWCRAESPCGNRQTSISALCRG